MSEFTVEEMISKMEATGLVPVFNHHDVNTASEVLVNAYEAGIKVFEFTNRGQNALEVFSELTKIASQWDDLVLGIGTIWSLEEASKFLKAGAQFIVSPALIPEMGEVLEKKGIFWIPGCGTITEVHKAAKLGAKVIKVFPGNVLGPAFVKAVKSVLPEVRIMPTGGVKPTAENLDKWFAAGVLCVGMGSQLFSKNLISTGNYSQLQGEISDALSLVRSVRNNV